MIIEDKNNINRFNDKNSMSSNFENKFKQYSENKVVSNNIFVKNIKDQKYTNVNNKDDMYNKSLAMLNERLSKGLISFEEFNKQVNALARKRQK